MGTTGSRSTSISVLYDRLAGPECYVSFQRWLRRDPAGRQPSLQPDLLVALGVPDALRRVYNPWELGKPPTLVAEWLSDSSLTADRTSNEASGNCER